METDSSHDNVERMREESAYWLALAEEDFERGEFEMEFIELPRPKPQDFTVVVRPMERGDRCAGVEPLKDADGKVQAFIACHLDTDEINKCVCCGCWFCGECWNSNSMQLCDECMGFSPSIITLIQEFRGKLSKLL